MRSLALALAALLALSPAAFAAESGPKRKVLSAADTRAVEALAKDYMAFLAHKIPVRRVEHLVGLAERAGFRPFSADAAWKPGARYYAVNHDRALLLFVAGKRPLADGVRLIGAHLDSPRLELRARPIKPADGLLFLKTEPYGGVKRYQWANLPLALVGQVARKDGRVVDVSLGEGASDPVFMLPDLAPHVDKDYRARPASQVFKGDELSLLAATGADKAGAKAVFLDELKRRYGLSEDDLVSADLAFVPAMPPREVGLDRALLGAYGQDDGLCSFASARSLFELTAAPDRTAVVYLMDHEEVGNTNTTGVRSRFLSAAFERMLAREGRSGAANTLSHLLMRSEGLSADASQALNPLFPSTEDVQGTARLGFGLTLKHMKAGLDGSIALRARLRRLLDAGGIPWQTYAYKVDGGGGKTIGSELQELGIDVVDVGAPLLAMHGTFEVSAKRDVHALKQLFDGFLAGR